MYIRIIIRSLGSKFSFKISFCWFLCSHLPMRTSDSFSPWKLAAATSGTQPKSQSWQDRSALGLQLSWMQGSTDVASLLLPEEAGRKPEPIKQNNSNPKNHRTITKTNNSSFLTRQKIWHSYTALYIIFVKPHDQVWQDDIFETLTGISPSRPSFWEYCLRDWMDSRQRQKGSLPGFWISDVCALRTGRVYYKAKYSEETMN